MESTKNGVPMLNGHNGLKYDIWIKRTKTLLQAQGCDICYSIVT
jgi:hypothetical protein